MAEARKNETEDNQGIQGRERYLGRGALGVTRLPLDTFLSLL